MVAHTCWPRRPVGINIVLISRTESKLRDLAAELESQHGVKCKYVAADLTSCSAAKWEELSTVLSGLDLGLLVNNAGASYDHCERTELLDGQALDDMVEMNIVALTKVCLPCCEPLACCAG